MWYAAQDVVSISKAFVVMKFPSLGKATEKRKPTFSSFSRRHLLWESKQWRFAAILRRFQQRCESFRMAVEVWAYLLELDNTRITPKKLENDRCSYNPISSWMKAWKKNDEGLREIASFYWMKTRMLVFFSFLSRVTICVTSSLISYRSSISSKTNSISAGNYLFVNFSFASSLNSRRLRFVYFRARIREVGLRWSVKLVKTP